MPRPKKFVPSYLLHRPSGQAVAKFTTSDGRRYMLYLGVFNSSASREEYERLLASLRTGESNVPVSARANVRGGRAGPRPDAPRRPRRRAGSVNGCRLGPLGGGVEGRPGRA